MKLSVSLPTEDVTILDQYVRAEGLGSRSAGIHRALQLLRFPDIEVQYEHAWREWDESGDSADWEATVGDGITDATR